MGGSNLEDVFEAILAELGRLKRITPHSPEMASSLADLEGRCNTYRQKPSAVASTQLGYISDLALRLCSDTSDSEVRAGLQLISSLARYRIDVRSEAERGRHHQH
jgi:hypothetical protein